MPSDDSDYIDSDTEAYLYSKVHHEFEPTPTCDSNSSATYNSSLKTHSESGTSKQCYESFERQKSVTSQNSSYVLPAWSTSWKETLNQQVKRPYTFVPNSTHVHVGSEQTSSVKSSCETEHRTFNRVRSVTINDQCLKPTIKVMYNVELQAEKENRRRPVIEHSTPPTCLKSKRQKSVNSSRKRRKSDSSSDSSDVVIQKWEDGKKQKVVINIDSSTDNSCVIVESDNEVQQKLDQSLWKIATEDRYKSERPRNRLMNVICYNCRDRGHLSKSCKKPRRVESCYLCGEPGHRGEYCLNPICTKCLLPGHWHYQCLWSPNTTPPCALCHTKGHLCQECPEIWRRYHLTTSFGPIVTSSRFQNPRQKSTFCYNCGLEGHYGYNCTRRKTNSSIYPVNRMVNDYSDPRKLMLNKINIMLWRQKLKLSRKAEGGRRRVSSRERQVSKKRKLNEKPKKRKKKVKGFVKGVGDIVRINFDEEESFPRSRKAKFMKKAKKQNIRHLKEMSRRTIYHNIVTDEYQERI